jgi:hypothetical protein
MKAHLPKLLANALLLFACSTSYGQAALIVGLVRAGVAVTTLATAENQFRVKGNGSYQLNTANWESGPLQLTNYGLVIGKRKEEKNIDLQEFRQVVISIDTFAVLHNVKFPDQDLPSAVPIVGRRTWRRPQVELFEFSGASGTLPVLRFPDQSAIALPVKNKEFRAAMLTLVGDHAILAGQLRKDFLTVTNTRAILEAYLNWKPEGFVRAGAAPKPAGAAGGQ